MPNFEPLIKGISEFIGAGAKAAKGAAKGTMAHTPTDVERWLTPLTAPEKQLPVLHDYLRGHAALSEIEATGAPHVRDISKGVWESTQRHLQQRVDQDPEIQTALKNLYMGKNTPKDPDITSSVVKEVEAPPVARAVEVPQSTSKMPQATPTKSTTVLDPIAKKNRADSWNEFAISLESQDGPRIEASLERIKALHEPDMVNLKPGESPTWEKALDYMSGLEAQAQQWRAAKVPNEEWGKLVEQYREGSGIDQVALPKHVRNTVERFEAWADAQKPPTATDRAAEILGAPRAIMSSADLSAPGRQGLLMIGRKEYWDAIKPMVESWDDNMYKESQAYLRMHPDKAAADAAGLAITDLHSRLAPREEAFQSQLAERLPVFGKTIKSSQQAYTTFLNRLRMDVFSNTLKQAKVAGVNVEDPTFLKSLGEWINTSTGRGGSQGFNPGVLSQVLFSPRLAISRLQTFNPAYYGNLHPFVRTEALKANLGAAAAVYGLVTLAGMGGAKVTWDFRNSDAGKVRIGNLRYDLGGGHLQFLRLFTRLVTGQTQNSETGKVTNLGEKFGSKTRLDTLTDFLISKEAPIASFVTDMLRGKDMSGKPFNLGRAALERLTPLAMQDMYQVLKDKGIAGLVAGAPALVGVGVQDYAAKPQRETIPFIGVKGEVPEEKVAEYAKMIEDADTRAATMAASKTAGKSAAVAKAVLKDYVRAERLKVRKAWILQNQEAFKQAKMAGTATIPLVAPEGTPQ